MRLVSSENDSGNTGEGVCRSYCQFNLNGLAVHVSAMRGERFHLISGRILDNKIVTTGPNIRFSELEAAICFNFSYEGLRGSPIGKHDINLPRRTALVSFQCKHARHGYKWRAAAGVKFQGA